MAKKTKTSIAIEPEVRAEIEAEAAKHGASWTVFLVVLAREALAARKARA